jgi:hypothetical protein
MNRPGYLAPLRARTPGYIRPVRARIAVAEAPRRQRHGVRPVVFGTSKRTQCKPFLVVQKDPELFAACNALADEVGPINTPKKAFRLLEELPGEATAPPVRAAIRQGGGAHRGTGARLLPR